MLEFFNNFDVSYWLLHYGGAALFLLLAGGIVGWPVPDELLLVLTGALMKRGKLNIPLTMISAYLGSFFGISMSYLIGRLGGAYILKKRWFKLSPEKLLKTKSWFEDYGKWTLFFGFYIPGVRHFTGFVAGLSKMNFFHFALFAFSGAFVWVTTFILIGFHLRNWHHILTNIAYGTEKGIILCVIIFFFYWFKKNIDKSFPK